MNNKKMKALLVAAIMICSLSVFSHQTIHVHAATCDNCGSTKTVKRVAMEATCEDQGLYTLICANCGSFIAEVTTDALGHKYKGTVEEEATCEDWGLMLYTCTRCGDKYEDEIEPVDHKYSVTLSQVAATCTKNGSAVKKCKWCDETKTVTISKTGHQYNEEITKEASCGVAGSKIMTCTVCGETHTEEIAALEHQYEETVIQELSCENDGISSFTCSACQNTYTETTPAYGHDYIELSYVAPTCSEDGERVQQCNNCQYVLTEIISALGHQYVSEVTLEPTCTAQGSMTKTCSVCGNVAIEEIAMLEHEYPEEWTVERKATLSEAGLQYKLCVNCSHRIEEEIPKLKIGVVPIVAGGGAIAAIGYVIATKLGIIGASAAAATVTSTESASAIGAVGALGIAKFGGKAIKKKLGVPKPSLPDKVVLLCLNENDNTEDLTAAFRSKHFLEVSTSEREELAENAAENEPDIIIVEVSDGEQFDQIAQLSADVKEQYEDAYIALIVEETLFKEKKSELQLLKEEETIQNYLPVLRSNNVELLNLLLPIYKPDLKSDDSLEYFAEVADAFGFPAASTLINIYLAGKDIKENMDEDEKGVSEIAAIIGDIASVFGFETIETIAGLVDSADSVKAFFDEESGAYEAKEGASAAMDIVDVVKEFIE